MLHEFVDYIPEKLRDDTVYVSIRFATVVHKCCCGCGHEVVTPLSPTNWTLSFDGRTISLSPSIGNWSFPCQSHYWITHNRLEWGHRWTQKQIDAGRARDRRAKERYYGGSARSEPARDKKRPQGPWRKLKSWFR